MTTLTINDLSIIKEHDNKALVLKTTLLRLLTVISLLIAMQNGFAAPSPSDDILNQKVVIMPKHSEKCLDINQYDENAQQWDCLYSNNQFWEVEPVNQDNGIIRIKRWETNKCLEVAKDNDNIGANVYESECRNGNTYKRNQQFTLFPHDDGSYHIVYMFPNLCLDIEDGFAHNGANLGLWECQNTDGQRFYFEAQPVSIKAKHSGKCLDVAEGGTSNGANVQQWDCNGVNHQLWNISPNLDGTFLIKSHHSGMCLDVEAGSDHNGANIQQWQCNNTEAQSFSIEQEGDAYQIKPKHSGKCLDIEAGSNGANLVQWDCGNKDWQRFYLLR